MRLSHYCFVLLTFGAMSVDMANAWWSTGHRIIANITYDRLPEKDRAEVVRVLRQHPRFDEDFLASMPMDIRKGDVALQDRWIFLHASVWPDQIRRKKPWDHPTWHYVNQPYFLTDLDRKALQNNLDWNVSPKLPDVAYNDDPQDLNVIQALKLIQNRLRDKSISNARKAVYYCWLLHLVGDIHQPMHSTSLVSRGRFNSSGGDRGGNLIRTKQRKNLHALWDSLPGDDTTLNDVRGKAKSIIDNKEINESADKAKNSLEVTTWVAESHDLAKKHVYCDSILAEVKSKDAMPELDLAAITLTEEYLRNAGTISQRRLAEAGFRLATIIDSIIVE